MSRGQSSRRSSHESIFPSCESTRLAAKIISSQRTFEDVSMLGQKADDSNAKESSALFDKMATHLEQITQSRSVRGRQMIG
jgi:hypothetical protein